MGFFETLKNKSAAKKAGLTYEQYIEYLAMAESKGYSLDDYRMHLKAVAVNMTDEQYKEFVADFSEMQPEQCLHFYKARSEGLDVQAYDEYLDKYQSQMSAAQYRDYLTVGKSYMSIAAYTEYLQKNPQSNAEALELYITTQKAQKLNMTVPQFREYTAKYSATLSAEQYLMFCNARTIGLSLEQFIEYWSNYRDKYTLERFYQYCLARKEGLTLEQYDEWKANYATLTIVRYHELLKAQSLRMTLEQYDEYTVRFAAEMSSDQYLMFCNARDVGLSLEEFKEYWHSYQETYTLERYYQYCQAKKEDLSLEQYDEWKADYSTLSATRFHALLEARKQNMTLEAYEELQSAQKLGLTVEQYREKKLADSLGIRVEDLPFYRACKADLENGKSSTVVTSWEEVKVANKLRIEKIILNAQYFSTIPERAFWGCDSFCEIILPWGISEIGKNAFSQCSSLRNMTIPGSVKSIPYGIFNGCSKLETIVLLSGIEKVDITGWADLPTLTSVVSAASIKDFVVNENQEKSYSYNDTSDYSFGLKVTATTDEQKNARTVILKKGYSHIWVTASLTDFVNAETLIVNCEYVDKIEINNCPKLKVIIVDGCIKRYVDRYKNGNVKKISTYTYDIKIPDNLEELKFFIVKNSLEKIEGGVGCPNLRWIHVPKGTSKIEVFATSIKAIGASSLPEYIHKVYINPEEISEKTAPLLLSCKFGKNTKIFYATNTLPRDVCEAEEIEILEGATIIPKELLSGCKMKTLRLPETIAVIGKNAFAECNNLQTVYLRSLPKCVGENAFQGCPIKQVHGISSLDVRKILGIYSAGLEDVANLDYSCLKGEIPAKYFSRSGATEAIIPRRIKTIGSQAFANSKNLEKIVFLGAPNEIAPDAFEGCTEVSEIQWGGCVHLAIAGSTGFPKIKKVEVPNEVTEIPDGCFRNWGIESVVLPNGTLKIGAKAFLGCPLEIVNDGEPGVLKLSSDWSIAKNAFSGCKLHTVICDCEEYEAALPALVAPETEQVFVRDTIPAEGFNAILKNPNLKEISCIETTNVVPTKKNAHIRDLPDNLRKLELPRSVIQIDCAALKECVSLEELVIPESIEVLKNADCISALKLKRLTIPEDLFHVVVKSYVSKKTKVVTTGIAHPEKYEITAVGEDAHLPDMDEKDRVLIQKLIIPENCISIADGAFENLINLHSVEINAPIQCVGARAFAGCVRLEQVMLPDSVDAIGEAAFEGCSELVRVEIPQTLTKLAARTFAGCSSMEAVAIPPILNAIGENAFEGCSSLKEVALPDALQLMGAYAFCGSGIVEVHIPGGIKRLAEGVFKNCTALVKVSGMQNVGYVDTDAFSGSAVVDLVFSEEIFSIQDAFKECEKLERIFVPVNIAKFSADLSGCTSLMNLYLPQQVDEFLCSTDTYNLITAHARRGSTWRQKINVHDVNYIKNAEYDELIRIELEKAGLHRSTEPETQMPATQTAKRQPAGQVSGTPHKRASWNTRSSVTASEAVFTAGPSTVDELLEKLQTNTAEQPYVIESVDCGLFAAPVATSVEKANVYVSEETRVITNNIFSITLKYREKMFPDMLCVVLVDRNGSPVSDLKKVCSILNSCESIDVQLQLNTGTANGDYYLMVLPQATSGSDVLCADKCTVDVAFAADVDFGF